MTPAAGRGGPAYPFLPVVEAGGAFVAIQGLGGGGGAIRKEPDRQEPRCAGLAAGLTSSTSDCYASGCSSLRLHSLKGNGPVAFLESRVGGRVTLTFHLGKPGLSAPPSLGAQPRRAPCASCLPGALGFTCYTVSHSALHSPTCVLLQKAATRNEKRREQTGSLP